MLIFIYILFGVIGFMVGYNAAFVGFHSWIVGISVVLLCQWGCIVEINKVERGEHLGK